MTSSQPRSEHNQSWQSVRSVGRQRLGRLGEILKAASKESLSELKAGTVEMEGLSREALERLIAEQKKAEFTEETARGWRPLLWDLGAIAQERKSDWLKQLATRLAQEIERFDGEMNHRYSDRYRPVSRPVNWLQTRLSRYGNQARQTDTAQPVEVEIVGE
ncbi:hypothetical protein C7271_13465 [filamentous cyanobacterium CCP5]|nr:hypothetical protein C7271_13465 [filamentous cyanobacterium CCP5]